MGNFAQRTMRRRNAGLETAEISTTTSVDIGAGCRDTREQIHRATDDSRRDGSHRELLKHDGDNIMKMLDSISYSPVHRVLWQTEHNCERLA